MKIPLSSAVLLLLLLLLSSGPCDSFPIGPGIGLLPWCIPILDLIPSVILGPFDYLKCASLIERGLEGVMSKTTTPSPLDEYLAQFGN